ncbi:MAG: TolC family protein [Planctomycetota bacterium]|nr:TolC family protein [Planctomycetota bacterium]MDA1247752.1 TolC family protein [Planctomycetota bacterium]
MALARSETIKVLNGEVRLASTTGFDSQIAETELTGARGAFDPQFSAAYKGAQIDQPPSSFFGPGIQTNTRRHEADVSAELSKKWPTGLQTSAGYGPSLAYLYFPGGNSSFNPAHSAEFVFKVEQPLLRGSGNDINTIPIRIASTQIEQTQWEVQAATQAQIRSVEEAYWSLNASLIDLHAVDGVIPLAEETVRIASLRLRAEQAIYADVARAEVKLEELRQQRLNAWLEARRREFQLRQLIGLPREDGLELIPADRPWQTAPHIHAASIVESAMQNRPDLIQRRLGLKIREETLLGAHNATHPELNLQAGYRVAGLSDRLDRSFDQVGSFDYEDWSLGVEFAVPLGNNRAKSQRAASELRLMRDRALLHSYEEQIEFELAELLANIVNAWRRFESAQRQVEQSQQWLKLARIRYSAPPDAGQRQDWLLLALADYQTAMQAQVDAFSTSGRMLARYNILLAQLAEAQGASFKRFQIELSTGDVQPVEALTMVPGHAISGGSDLETAPADFASTPRMIAERESEFQTSPVSFVTAQAQQSGFSLMPGYGRVSAN